MQNRPSDIVLPEGWTWERVEAERAKWGVHADFIPVAQGGGCYGWGTIVYQRWQRDHIPAGEVLANSSFSRIDWLRQGDLIGRVFAIRPFPAYAATYPQPISGPTGDLLLR